MMVLIAELATWLHILPALRVIVKKKRWHWTESFGLYFANTLFLRGFFFMMVIHR